MSTGKRICQDCNGNGFLKTEMNTVVQCLTCCSEGEVDESIWTRKYDPIRFNELRDARKED